MTETQTVQNGGAAWALDNGARFVTPEKIAGARVALETDGYLLFEDVYDPRVCRSIVSLIDEYAAAQQTEINYAGTEVRIWDAQSRHPALRRFTDECDRFLSDVTGQDLSAHTLLAIRNLPVDSSDAQLTMGRWHLDSFTRQLKVFLFLTDTTDASGPFEFLPRTQQTSFKLKMLLRGRYIRPSDVLGGRARTYSKLDDAWVSDLSHAGYGPLPVVCKAGTVMVVDSSAIHRARPCRHGSRYALTAYYR